jgi:hypothetical protein
MQEEAIANSNKLDTECFKDWARQAKVALLWLAGDGCHADVRASS